ncbi:hypothetical protein IEQ34_002073 [Dendrobium chrysotoxum]|uniref:Uncharacterized protein n=1 Tax=Dendrobium chrysotoxum TaxID=161865 RepID=A0AAV7HIJ6_DENCH|nr:hypothetical protein IEQ34_002073 [Dendrobium chrysotoxum]
MKYSIERMVNQNISNQLEMNQIHAKVMPTDKFSEYCDSSSGMTEDNLRLNMQLFNSNFSIGNDWDFESSAWDNLPSRTNNVIENYWNIRLKRQQRAGLPLYPLDIQRNVVIRNQRRGLMLL